MHNIKGEARSQGSLFPIELDELIPDDNLVRVIEAFMARLNLRELGTIRWQGNRQPNHGVAKS